MAWLAKRDARRKAADSLGILSGGDRSGHIGTQGFSNVNGADGTYCPGCSDISRRSNAASERQADNKNGVAVGDNNSGGEHNLKERSTCYAIGEAQGKDSSNIEHTEGSNSKKAEDTGNCVIEHVEGSNSSKAQGTGNCGTEHVEGSNSNEAQGTGNCGTEHVEGSNSGEAQVKGNCSIEHTEGNNSGEAQGDGRQRV